MITTTTRRKTLAPTAPVTALICTVSVLISRLSFSDSASEK